MKILYYNWAPLYLNQGGGVNIYLHNLLDYYKEKYKEEINIFFLNSGYFYDKKNKDPYLIEDKLYKGIKCYSIVNSPLIAPHGIANATSFNKSLKDQKIKLLIKNFIQENGLFDVIHFQSLEGLPVNVLSLKKEFPTIKFIHSLHDYGVFCRNVKFWTNENTNCVDCGSQRNCARCSLGIEIYGGSLSNSRWIHATNNRLIPPLLNRIYKSIKVRFKNQIVRRSPLIKNRIDNILKCYRQACIDYINKYIDTDLAVSARVKEIAVKYGINAEKVKVEYIGTKVAENQILPKKHNTFRLLFLGYANIQKGFYLLLDALEGIDYNISKNIALRFASKITHSADISRLNNLRLRYKEVELFDGYSHSDLPLLTRNVSLGIVPPVWEDNLPQVTIEMIANGIPVLTSSYGGAKELNSHKAFTFGREGGALKRAIENIYENNSLLKEYWEYSKQLVTMEAHIKNLLEIYK